MEKINSPHFEFAVPFGNPTPLRGLTSVEAIAYLQTQLPAYQDWMCWTPTGECAFAHLLNHQQPVSGQTAGWHWKRQTVNYPSVHLYQHHHLCPENEHSNWTGLLEVTAPDGNRFLLFSFLDASGRIGNQYFIHPARPAPVNEFNLLLLDQQRQSKPGQAVIHVVNGDNMVVDLAREERIFMPPQMLEDIDRQVDRFFRNPELFARMGLPYRRGMLFVGPPGCGKTMTVRRIVRNTRPLGVSCWSMRGKHSVDADILEALILQATRVAPSIILLEEIDGLLNDTQIDRASVLNALDGLVPMKGVLILATTNNPLKIDAAFSQRPSRFDRVWLFKAPDAGLRHEYLAYLFPAASPETLLHIARGTDNWSYAYLNEIRVTAAMLAVGDEADLAGELHILRAHELLKQQFESGRQNHAEWEDKEAVGFGA